VPASRRPSYTCASGIYATRWSGCWASSEAGSTITERRSTTDVEAAFTGPSFWAPLTQRCHAAGIPRLSQWLNTTGRIVADQFSRRGARSSRPADMPLSTSPLDGLVNPIGAAIQPRAYGLKNRERTNRMLMLMQLHANRQDDVRAYVRHIRDRLEANHGRPSIARRAVVVDAAGVASLR
jgi:hypothetical protein